MGHCSTSHLQELAELPRSLPERFTIDVPRTVWHLRYGGKGEVIHSFKDKDTETCFGGRQVQAGWQGVQRVALRKLLALNAAVEVNDLASPPGNQLEQLTKERAGQRSIRVNDKWRVCFVWKDNGAHEVEIVDYH